jgi:hypothetical protein
MKAITNKILKLTFLAMVVLPFTVRASTILAVSFENIVNNSELIFEGQVVTQETRRSKQDGTPFTYSTFQVLDVIKGRVPAGGYLTLGFAGGTIDGMTLEVHDLRMPVLNEKGIYFVESMDKELVNPLYGWQQGHYLVIKDAGTGVEKVMSVIGRRSELVVAPTVNDFKRSIRSELGGVQ